MSKHRNRAKLKNAECGRDYHLISLNEWYPLYWDEGYNFYPYWNRGYKNPNKRIICLFFNKLSAIDISLCKAPPAPKITCSTLDLATSFNNRLLAISVP